MGTVRTLLADVPNSILMWMEVLVASAGVCLVLAGIPWFGEAVRDLTGNQFGVRQLVLAVTCTVGGLAGGVSAGLAPNTGWSTRPASAVHAVRTLTVVCAALFSILSATGFVPSPVVSIATLAGVGLPSLSAGRISGAKAIMTVPLAFLFAWPFLLLSALPPSQAGWLAGSSPDRCIRLSNFPEVATRAHLELAAGYGCLWWLMSWSGTPPSSRHLFFAMFVILLWPFFA